MTEMIVRSWIPVTERVPETEDYVLCTTVTKKGFRNLIIGYHANGRWCVGMNSNVVAWMPLPEPWKGEDDAEVHRCKGFEESVRKVAAVYQSCGYKRIKPYQDR